MPVIIEVKTVPGAKKQRISVDTVADIRCYVTAQAQDNKANEALITLLADALDIPKRAVTILAGHTARHKRLQIDGFTHKNDIFNKLGLEVQRALF